MKKKLREMYLETVRKLAAAFSVEGRGALVKMQQIEVNALFIEKMGELNTVNEKLAAFPHDELSQCRKAKLQCEIKDMVGYMREHFGGKGKDRGHER